MVMKIKIHNRITIVSENWILRKKISNKKIKKNLVSIYSKNEDEQSHKKSNRREVQ